MSAHGGDFRHLPVDLIDVPADRARFLNAAKAEAIGATMRAERQFDPITVCPAGDRYMLVDGQHRLQGARQFGLETIEARVVALSAKDQRKQEVLSNLATAELDALGRARSLDALCNLLKERDKRAGKVGRPLTQAIAIEAKNICASECTNFGWSEAAAAAVGLERRALYNYLRVARRLVPEATAEIAGTDLADNLKALLKLSDMGDFEQVEVARAYRSGGFASVTDAHSHVLGKVKPAAPSKEEQDYQRLVAIFGRLPKKMKAKFLNEVVCHDEDCPAHIRACIGGVA